MPNALIALPDVYESITRRVSVAVAEHLARVMRLPGETRVQLPGQADTVPMNGGSFQPAWDPGVTYPAASRLTLRYTEEFDESYTLTTPVNNTEQMPLFRDEVRDITCRPVYRYATMTVSMEYTAPSLVLAQRWIDEMRARVSMGRAELYFDVEYHYAIPDGVLVLLHHLHSKMEASAAPTGMTFQEYLDKHLYLYTKTLTDLVGNSPTRVVPEHQHEVLGWFDFTTSPPSPEKSSNSDGSYTTTLTYTFHYNRPMQLYCQYPLLIHNQLISPEFRPEDPYTTFHQVDRRVSRTKGSFDALRALMERRGIPYLQLPDVDDWVPDRIPEERLTFFTGLVAVDPADPTAVMELSKLGQYKFTTAFLEYFYHQGAKLFGYSSSIFEFRLYENHRLATEFGLSLDGVMVRTDQPMDLTRYYHLQISLKRNWIVLNPETVSCLRRYPTVTYLSLQALGVRLGNRDYEDLQLLGQGRPRPTSLACPGEGELTQDPAQWPWPWVEDPDAGWPGVPEGYPGSGVVRNEDIRDAITETDSKAGNYVDRVRIGPMNVLYAHILTERR